MQPRWRETWGTIRGIAVAAITVVTLFGIVLPWNPRLPVDTTLDSSWSVAMNEAIARGIPYGTDLVFTYGPYTSLYTREYHPATTGLLWGGSLLLAAAFSAAFLLLAAKSYPVRLTLGLIGIAGLALSPDPLLLSYVLLVAMVVYVRHVHAPSAPAWEAAALAFLLVPLGVLPLIKGSLLAPVLGQSLLNAAALTWIGKRRLALLCVAVPFLAWIAFWLLAGQSLGSLPSFVVNQLRIISGYTDAMSIGWDARQLVAYVVAAALLLYAVASGRDRSILERGFLVLSLGLVLFAAFKGGFVRHDPHALIAGGTLVIAALLVCLVQPRMPIVALLMCAFAWDTIDAVYRGTSLRGAGQALAATYAPFVGGRPERSLPEELAARHKQLVHECELPALEGTSDIYSVRQACLLLSTNRWSPRPVFQSYSAYTPELVELNERHLRGDAAPDNIFMAIEPIDERLPALEDGHSWLTLLRSYDFHSRAGGFFVLRRRTEPHPEPARRELSSAEHAIGDVIPVPPTSSAIFAEIDMRPSLLGRLASLFFKPPSLDLEVVTASERHKYRFVPGMARPSFPLSPLVKSTEEFLLFAARQPGFLAMERVESIRMRTHSRAYWASRFSLRLSEVELPSVDPAALALFFDARVPIDGDGAAPVACDGHLDSLNKVEPVPDQVQAVGAMRTRGWMAVSAKDGVLADRVLLALQAPDGKRSFFGTRPLWRPDVGAHYGQPSLAAAGFESVIDLSQLAGTYRLNPAHVYQGKLTLCEPTRALTVAAP